MTRSQRNKKQYETKDDNEMIGIQENVIYIYIYIYIYETKDDIVVTGIQRNIRYMRSRMMLQ